MIKRDDVTFVWVILTQFFLCLVNNDLAILGDIPIVSWIKLLLVNDGDVIPGSYQQLQ
jgi:hypothetical protein